MREATFFIDGHARTQGSLAFMGRGKGHHTRELLDWRKYVALTASQHWKGGPSDKKFAAGFCFTLPDKRPRDIDKLLRAMLDALTGVVWKDDSQVFRLASPTGKRFVNDGHPGVWVYLRELDDEDKDWPRLDQESPETAYKRGYYHGFAACRARAEASNDALLKETEEEILWWRMRGAHGAPPPVL